MTQRGLTGCSGLGDLWHADAAFPTHIGESTSPADDRLRDVQELRVARQPETDVAVTSRVPGRREVVLLLAMIALTLLLFRFLRALLQRLRGPARAESS